MSENALLPFGLCLRPLQGAFSHGFLTQLQALIESLPGVDNAPFDPPTYKAWWLYGSTANLKHARQEPSLLHSSLVTISDGEVMLRFRSTTYEEHEAAIIHWVLERCACRVYDLDWGTELRSPDDLSRWMSLYKVRNTGMHQRAKALLSQALEHAFCHAVQYSLDHEFVILFSTASHSQRRLVVPEETVVLLGNLAVPSLNRTQSVMLHLLELCGSYVSSVLFTPDRVLHLIFDQNTPFNVCSNAPGEYENAWALEGLEPDQPHLWVKQVWVPQGGDLLVHDAAPS